MELNLNKSSFLELKDLQDIDHLNAQTPTIMAAFCFFPGTPPFRTRSEKLSASFKQTFHPTPKIGKHLSKQMNSDLESAAPNPTPQISTRQKMLYPPITPYCTGHLEVSPTHRVYYEISGNPKGLPVCFVHGGPGGGTVPAHRRFFDPKVYKIILFDQRGCGKSTPTACLEENTTWDLISDMELVREAAEVEQWILFGGSWGATLAVTYAQTHPERVIAMILRGIFMIREKELQWLYERRGAAMLYPEAFARYVQGLPEEVRGSESLMDAYYAILSQDQDSTERRTAASAWSKWEHTLSKFPRDGAEEEDRKSEYSDEDLLAFARIESHYFVNKGWLKEDGFLLKEEQMKKIRHIKTCIVQGRWDVVCPRTSAYELEKMFDGEDVETILIELAGHSTFEPGIEETLLNACDRFGKEFGWMSGGAIQ